ncbi:rhomboid family intramembrane serine protease [Jannaschia sp. S6380]|nr:rhomboid family intramembrane serine protease [Jannaschia sp. S6380]MCK0168093.1 rhomboid family intramembrane serine protease [Jannaschia sp. S6380]
MDPRQQSPFNALPPIVVALAGAMVAIELLFQAGASGFVGGAEGVGWRLSAMQSFAVSEQVWDWMVETGQAPLGQLLRFVAYPFVHGGFTHTAFVAVFVLALGNVVAPVYPAWRFAAIFFAATLGGALAYLLLFETRAPLIGGFPAAYGLIGAFTYLTQRGLTRADPSRAFLLIGFLLAIQPVFGLLIARNLGWVPDWTADLAGAATGYGMAALLFPGAMHRIRDRLRQR